MTARARDIIACTGMVLLLIALTLYLLVGFPIVAGWELNFIETLDKKGL